MRETRVPRLDDNKERQLLNVVEEMALAAGLPTPRVVIADSTVVNAMVAGASHEAATVLVTRALLDHLNRDQIQGVIAHCIGSIGNGDLRVMHSLMATLQTLALVQTVLDLPLRRSAWGALVGFLRAVLAPQSSPTRLREATRRIEQSFDRSLPASKALMIPLFPLAILSGLQSIALGVWCSLLLNWPLALLWRTRRYLADSTAVQLSRNPDALAAALSQFAAHAGVPAGSEDREYLFMCGFEKSELFARYGMFFLSMHPPLERRLKRLQAMGASRADDEPKRPWGLRRAVWTALFGIIVSPLLLIMALGFVGAIFSSMYLAVSFSLVLGLGFLALVFSW
jgi:Zn-dependent protease with chaperone function